MYYVPLSSSAVHFCFSSSCGGLVQYTGAAQTRRVSARPPVYKHVSRLYWCNLHIILWEWYMHFGKVFIIKINKEKETAHLLVKELIKVYFPVYCRFFSTIECFVLLPNCNDLELFPLLADPRLISFAPSCAGTIRKPISLRCLYWSIGLRNMKTNWRRSSWLKSRKWMGLQRNVRGMINY